MGAEQISALTEQDFRERAVWSQPELT